MVALPRGDASAIRFVISQLQYGPPHERGDAECLPFPCGASTDHEEGDST